MLRGGRRVLVLWDAHGPAVARHMLSRIAPALAGREHLIVVHDIFDARYQPVNHEYVTATGQQNWWRGHLVSDCEELDPIFDFVSRNGIHVHTAGHSASRLCLDAAAEDVVATAARGIVGSTVDLFPGSHTARLAYFSCHDRTSARPLVFPPEDDGNGAEAGVASEAGDTAGMTSVALDLARFLPAAGTIAATPDGSVQIVTPPLPWGFAATLPLPGGPADNGTPSGAVRVRAEVTNAIAGIGVLARDGKSFVDRRLVAPSGAVVEVLLRVPRVSLAGGLVVQTWDLAASATVRIESATLIVRDALKSA
jgi:hypothetical protein